MLPFIHNRLSSSNAEQQPAAAEAISQMNNGISPPRVIKRLANLPPWTDTKRPTSPFEQLTGRNRLTAAVKLIADWLSSNPHVMLVTAVSSRALLGRLVEFVNLMPDEQQLSERGECEEARQAGSRPVFG